MGDQLANNPEALRLFFNEDVYLLAEPELPVVASSVTSPISEAEIAFQTATEVKQVVKPIKPPVTAGLKLPADKLQTPHVDPAAAIPSLNEEPARAYGVGSDNLENRQQPGGHPAAEPLQASKAEQEIVFSYKGKNARNILILVYDEVNEVTTAEGRELFKNIVKAKELSGADYAIVNYAGYKSASFAQLKRFFNAKAVLTFGVNGSQLGLSEYPLHSVVKHDDVQLLFSMDLHQISLDKNIKRALWAALQQMEL